MMKPWLRKLLGLDRKKSVQPIVVHSYNEEDYHPDGRIIKPPTKPAVVVRGTPLPLPVRQVPVRHYSPSPVRPTTVVNHTTIVENDDDSLVNTIIAAEVINDLLTPVQPVQVVEEPAFQGFGGGDSGGAGAQDSWAPAPDQQDQQQPDPEPAQADPEPEQSYESSSNDSYSSDSSDSCSSDSSSGDN